MRILQVSTVDVAGGAEKVCRDLFQAYRARGQDSWLAVGTKRGDDPQVLEIPRLSAPRPPWPARLTLPVLAGLRPYQYGVPGIGRLRRSLSRLTIDVPAANAEFGQENFVHPGSHRLLELPPERPDVIQAHNLHGDYFDLRQLPGLSRRVPFFLTLHDAWLLSGHCAHSFQCERWRTGCGKCPDLSIPPAVRADSTAYNWQRKRALYARSQLYVATPCRWLMQKVEDSILAPGIVEAKVIPYGLDLSLFQGGSQLEARQQLGLDPDAVIILFTANWVQGNRWKDYATMKTALGSLGPRLPGRAVVFVALGDPSPAAEINGVKLHFVPHQHDPQVVTRYYQAADIYLHGARADTFPNSVLEALACGTPVVGTAVGGIPEQIRDGETGRLTPIGDPAGMAAALYELIINHELRQRMGLAARDDATRRFDLERQADEYLQWFATALARPAASRTKPKRPAAPLGAGSQPPQ